MRCGTIGTLVFALIGLSVWSGCAARNDSGEPPATPIPVAAAIPPAAGDQPAADQPAGDLPPALPLRVIRTAEIDLIVDDFDRLEAELAAIIAKSGGYIAASRVMSSASPNRHGTWTIRLPQTRITEGMTALRSLGELSNLRSQSQDVTTEFVDLSARVRNKEQEEQRLLTLLSEKAHRLDEILTLERELSRVRGEVERMQAQLRSLSDRTDFSTITLTATQRVPPAPVPVAIVPSFSDRMSTAFFGSSSRMLAVAEAALTGVVLFVPWIPMAAMVGLPFLLTRGLRKRPASGPGGMIR